jgi:hypothetical protein
LPIEITSSEASEILDNWRTPEQREIATEPLYLNNAWLRTYYGAGSDEKHQEFVDEINLEYAIDEENRLLNDADSYNFGDQWERILDIMPELVRRDSFRFDSYFAWVVREEEKCQRARRVLSGETVDVPETPGKAVQNTIDRIRERFPAEEVENEVMKAFQLNLHQACMVNWIYVFDEEAFNTKHFLMVWLDPFGEVVRSKRVENGFQDMFNGMFCDGAWTDMEEWESAEIGAAYKPGGVHENLYFLG